MQRNGYPVVVEDLHLNRGGRLVLAGIDAAFERARVTAVVGPSGAGKTSLLRCLNRLEEPDRGRILLDKTDIKTMVPTELRKRVGMIFQTPIVFEGGVRANLTYGLGEVPEDRLVDAVRAAGLREDFIARDSTALSVGQAQRVCIARALIRDPEVLLMDEPTSALDKDAAAKIEDLISHLTDRGLTVVLVTHNLAQAKRVSDRAVLLRDGRIVASGSPDEIEDAWPGETPA